MNEREDHRAHVEALHDLEAHPERPTTHVDAIARIVGAMYARGRERPGEDEPETDGTAVKPNPGAGPR